MRLPQRYDRGSPEGTPAATPRGSKSAPYLWRRHRHHTLRQIPAKAGATATPSGLAPRSAATAPIFHSFFIGVIHSSRIPARFEIGFSLPEGRDRRRHHRLPLLGRVLSQWRQDGYPVDALEAWKDAAKHDCFFGAHDVNRVFFTYGRDIRLPNRKGDPLNYFIYPYAEINGQTVKNLQTHFSFPTLPQHSRRLPAKLEPKLGFRLQPGHWPRAAQERRG